MAIPRNWDTTSPADNGFLSQFPANERDARDAVREIFGVDHVNAEDGTQGKHRALRLRSGTLPGASGTEGVLGTELRPSTGRHELRYRDDTGIQIWLTEAGDIAAAADPGTQVQAAQLKRTTSQSIANIAETQINFTASDFDTLGGVADTGNNRFVVPAGFRFVQVSILTSWFVNANGTRLVNLLRNGVAVGLGSVGDKGGIAATTFTAPLTPSVVNDIYTFEVSQDSGSSLNLTRATASILLLP